MKFSLGWKFYLVVGGISLWCGKCPGGKWANSVASGGLPSLSPSKENPERGEWNLKKTEKKKWVVSKEICIT